ncbi:hypothetical protein KODAMA_02190 [Serratia phage vB_SmaM-Kodama]|nr:hypothetical protein KODAMA_02190 [Serratia phage vB_SmaM-Kodama]
MALANEPAGEVILVSCKVKSLGLEFISELTYKMEEDVSVIAGQSVQRLLNEVRKLAASVNKRTFFLIYPWEFLKVSCESDIDYISLFEEAIKDTQVTLLIFHKPSTFKYNDGTHPKLRGKIKTSYKLSKTEFSRTIVKVKGKLC